MKSIPFLKFHHGASVPEIPSFMKEIRTNPDLLKQDFHELQLHYADYQHISTDGSKKNKRVGCAVYDHQTMRIPDGSSVFTAEAKAIDLALDLVVNCNSTVAPT